MILRKYVIVNAQITSARKTVKLHKWGANQMSELYERIDRLCKDRKTNVTAMCRESGAPRGSLTDLKSGRIASLSLDTLTKIASYFGVSVEYLTTGEKEKAPATEGERGNIQYDDFTYAMHNETKDLPDEKKEMLLNMARFFREEMEKGNERSGGSPV